jgi:hypothetical protein
MTAAGSASCKVASRNTAALFTQPRSGPAATARSAAASATARSDALPITPCSRGAAGWLESQSSPPLVHLDDDHGVAAIPDTFGAGPGESLDDSPADTPSASGYYVRMSHGSHCPARYLKPSGRVVPAGIALARSAGAGITSLCATFPGLAAGPSAPSRVLIEPPILTGARAALNRARHRG